jgi:lipoprotein-releasing system permease protein
MNGFQLEMLRQMAEHQRPARRQGTRDGLQATPELLARRAGGARGATATPAAEGQVIAVAGEKVRGVLLRGMSADDFRAGTPLAPRSTAAPACASATAISAAATTASRSSGAR